MNYLSWDQMGKLIKLIKHSKNLPISLIQDQTDLLHELDVFIELDVFDQDQTKLCLEQQDVVFITV